MDGKQCKREGTWRNIFSRGTDYYTVAFDKIPLVITALNIFVCCSKTVHTSWRSRSTFLVCSNYINFMLTLEGGRLNNRLIM
jgi:hypothetical protein